MRSFSEASFVFLFTHKLGKILKDIKLNCNKFTANVNVFCIFFYLMPLKCRFVALCLFFYRFGRFTLFLDVLCFFMIFAGKTS